MVCACPLGCDGLSSGRAPPPCWALGVPRCCQEWFGRGWVACVGVLVLRLAGGGVDDSHGVGRLLCLGPGLKGGEIRHIVIFSSLIQLSALLHKGWAGPVPACMAVTIT